MRGEFEVQSGFFIDKIKNLKTARKKYNFYTTALEWKCNLIQFIELSDGIKIGIDISNKP